MKKYIGILAVILLVPFKSFATTWTDENCTAYGGTIITANSYGNDKSGGLCHDPSDPNVTHNCNGKRFCMGGNTMNWWSAFTWCESIGGQLVTFESMCPGSQMLPNEIAGACPNIKGSGGNYWAWTNIGWDTSAISVRLSDGMISTTRRVGRLDTSHDGLAFCEEK